MKRWLRRLLGGDDSSGSSTIEAAREQRRGVVTAARLGLIGTILTATLTFGGAAVVPIVDDAFSSPETCAAAKIHDASELRDDGLITDAEFEELKDDAIADELADDEFNGCTS